MHFKNNCSARSQNDPSTEWQSCKTYAYRRVANSRWT